MGKRNSGVSAGVALAERAKKMRGVLRYRVYRRGQLVEEAEDYNLIVDIARVQMAHLVAGEVTNRQIMQIAVGTNGTAPTVDDTAITNPFIKPVDGHEYPEPGQVQFNWSIGTGEANGKAILEFGLITADGGLFSRRVRSMPINKDSDVLLEGTWTIEF